MVIAIGSDHAGFHLKEKVKAFLSGKGYTVSDKGCFSEERVDYPDFAREVCAEITNNRARFGILICGSGNGISIAANRNKGIRCALCWNADVAALARQHNDANIISLPARFIESGEAEHILTAFFEADFEGGRHKERVDKIDRQA